MRVIVTGSREYRDRAFLRARLDEAYEVDGELTLLHGACPIGADWFAWEWAIDRQRGPEEYANVRVVRFPADWRQFGRAAGMIRNADMVKAGADRVLAFFAPPPAENKGTSHCAELARRAGIPVREYGRDIQETDSYEQETLGI